MTELTAEATTRLPLAGRSLLRTALKLDAAVTGANAAAYLAAAEPLSDLFGLPVAQLRATGAFLALFAAAVWLVGTRDAIPRGAVRAVIAANAGWVLLSAVAAAAGWGSPETAGTVWIALQAAAVGGLAELQVAGLPREPR
ncbi:MAG TPA: hypothetical protein VF533_13890 [Solirubrobacteraceae bacterium]|jgi:hypothetical protein